MNRKFPRRRRSTGQVISVLGLGLAVFVIGVLGVMAFEFVRLTIARDQLRTATDAGALAAAAALAGSDFANPRAAHTNAMTAARAIFSANDVMGATLTNLRDTSVSRLPPPPPTRGEAVINFQLFDNQGAPKGFGDPTAKVIQMSANYGYTPLFGAFIGMVGAVMPLSVNSRGGVPTLDLVLCFDVSGSMDDSTNVTVVDRTWNDTNKKIEYFNRREGTILDVFPSSLTGCQVNAFYPQRLTQSNFAADRGGGPLNWDPVLRNTPNKGSPPGNHPDFKKSDTGDFTDVVVNFSGTSGENPAAMTFPFTSADGKFYPSLGAVVEASRGNLDSAALWSADPGPGHSNAITALNATNPLGGPGNSPSMSAGQLGGYKIDYETNAQANIHPIVEAIAAVQDFFNTMKTNADSHFSLVAFGGVFGPAVDPSTSFDQNKFDYPAGSSGYVSGDDDDPVACPLPLVPLSLTDANFSGANSVGNKVEGLKAFDATFMGNALNEAIGQLTGPNTRVGSKKAIVLFTDGLPSGGVALTTVAQTAKSAGIKVFCVCLAQTSTVDTAFSAELLAAQKANMDPLANTTGGQAFYTTSGDELTSLFRLVAKALTQLVSKQ